MNNPASNANGHSAKSPALIVFGKHRGQRAHAAWFRAANANVARWIAVQLGFSVIAVESAATRTLTKCLTEWQLEKDGLPVLPIVKQEVFDKLGKMTIATDFTEGDHISTPAAAMTNLDATANHGAAKLRSMARPLWNELAVGQLVLATDFDRTGPAEAWYTAVILALHGGAYILAWCDFPNEGLIRRERHHIALLHPTD